MRPGSVYHLSAYRRRDGCRGGVEKFGWHLERAIGCQLIVDQELNGILPSIPKNTLFIVDGGHGLEIPDEFPILSVCHGTWVGVWARWGWTTEMQGYKDAPYEASQVAMWGTPEKAGKFNVLPVAVSAGAKRELIQYHARPDAPILLHGIDHDVFTPKKNNNAKPVILHVANEWRKGDFKVKEIAERLPQFQFEFLNAAIGEEAAKFQRGDMFIHISCSEGNAYACLEAMSCNLPMVVTNVGLFESDIGSSSICRVVNYVEEIDRICEAIVEVWETRDRYNPREWIEQSATFAHFKERWLDLMQNAENYGLSL